MWQCVAFCDIVYLFAAQCCTSIQIFTAFGRDLINWKLFVLVFKNFRDFEFHKVIFVPNHRLLLKKLIIAFSFHLLAK